MKKKRKYRKRQNSHRGDSDLNCGRNRKPWKGMLTEDILTKVIAQNKETMAQASEEAIDKNYGTTLTDEELQNNRSDRSAVTSAGYLPDAFPVWKKQIIPSGQRNNSDTICSDTCFFFEVKKKVFWRKPLELCV